MPKKSPHFKSPEAYRKWLAYGHIRTPSGKVAKHKGDTVFAKTPGHQTVYVEGKKVKVEHGNPGRCSKLGYCKAHRTVHY